MKIHPEVAAFYEKPSLVFPILGTEGALKGSEMPEIFGKCSKCGKVCINNRGTITEGGNHFAVDMRGACYSCKLIVPFRFRYYPEGRRLMVDVGKPGQSVWVEQRLTTWNQFIGHLQSGWSFIKFLIQSWWFFCKRKLFAN